MVRVIVIKQRFTEDHLLEHGIGLGVNKYNLNIDNYIDNLTYLKQ